MSPSGNRDRKASRRRLLDDATAEDLVAGRSKAGTGDLGALSALLEDVRSLGAGPAPPASPGLARILAGDPVTGDGAEGAPATRRGRLARFLTPGPVRSRWADDGLVVKAALVLLVAAASLTAAGAARLLPGAAQHLVARALEALTPVEFSERGHGLPTPDRPPETLGAGGAAPPVTAGAGQGQGDPPSSPTAGHPGGTGPRPPSTAAHRGDRSPVSEPPSSDLRPSRSRRPPGPPGRAATAPLTATLTGGSIQTSAPGDPDGRGIASVSVVSDRGLLCVTVTVTGIAPVSSVHLHEASPKATAPLVVSLYPHELTGCVPVDAKVLAKVDRKPAGYYVEVHTAEFPGGALRGQLSR